MPETVDLLKLYIGSSLEGEEVAKHLQMELQNDCEATVWSQGIFGLSSSTLEALIKASKEYDFAVLVLTPDDVVLKREIQRPAARDNVLLELGLFMGSLGRERTFIVHCKEDKIDLPTDLEGITRATYLKRKDGNLEAALSPVGIKIRQAMHKVMPKVQAIKDEDMDTFFGFISRQISRSASSVTSADLAFFYRINLIRIEHFKKLGEQLQDKKLTKPSRKRYPKK